MIEPLDLKKFYTLDTPRSYLLMPGSHELLFTNPEGLADKIIEAGRV